MKRITRWINNPVLNYAECMNGTILQIRLTNLKQNIALIEHENAKNLIYYNSVLFSAGRVGHNKYSYIDHIIVRNKYNSVMLGKRAMMRLNPDNSFVIAKNAKEAFRMFSQ